MYILRREECRQIHRAVFGERQVLHPGGLCQIAIVTEAKQPSNANARGTFPLSNSSSDSVSGTKVESFGLPLSTLSVKSSPEAPVVSITLCPKTTLLNRKRKATPESGRV